KQPTDWTPAVRHRCSQNSRPYASVVEAASGWRVAMVVVAALMRISSPVENELRTWCRPAAAHSGVGPACNQPPLDGDPISFGVRPDSFEPEGTFQRINAIAWGLRTCQGYCGARGSRSAASRTTRHRPTTHPGPAAPRPCRVTPQGHGSTSRSGA